MNIYKKLLTFLVIIVCLLIISAVINIYINKDKETSAEKVAENYIRAHSVEGLEYTLQLAFDDGTFVKYYIIPKSEVVDEAQIYLKKTNRGYKVIGFGTAFPELEIEYPELKGRI